LPLSSFCRLVIDPLTTFLEMAYTSNCGKTILDINAMTIVDARAAAMILDLGLDFVFMKTINSGDTYKILWVQNTNYKFC
jgi:hypothetical protein